MYVVIGHRNPDTDSFCSSVVFAQYLRDTNREATPYSLWIANKETRFVFDYWRVGIPEEKINFPDGTLLALVDHNEAVQSVPNREKHTIAMVIDHHKVSDFSTPTPPQYMRVQAVWCTATILHQIFTGRWYTPTREMAGLMISAIISDTLLFRSPTTTQQDKDAVAQLQLIAGIKDIEEYAMRMFEAKSDLWDMPVNQILTLDYKNFTIGGKKIGIGVMETTNPHYALQKKPDILQAMHQHKHAEDLDYILFCVVDILQEKNTAFVLDTAEADLIQGAFEATTSDNIADLWHILSRKKELVPRLEHYYASK